MSSGLMCDCPLPPMKGLKTTDRAHSERPGGKPGCPNYADDQRRGGLCRFCAEAHRLLSRQAQKETA
jgi:hypothetical protein